MVTIVNTGVTLSAQPIGFIPQTYALLTYKFEIVKPDNTTYRPYTRRAQAVTPDISIPSRVWIFSPRETEGYSHIIVYDLDTNQEVAKTDTDINLSIAYDFSLPIMIFTEWGEKYYLMPLNARRGRASIWGYATLGYSRINVYWSYREMLKYAWETGWSPGFVSVGGVGAINKLLYLIGSILNEQNVAKLLRTHIIYYLGFGSWWSYMFDEVFVANATDWTWGVFGGNVLIIEKDDIWFTYKKDVTSTESQIVLRRLTDGTEIVLATIPRTYGSYAVDWRRCAKNKILFAIYYGDVRNNEMKYGAPPANLQLVVVDLSTLTVTDLGTVATSTNLGNAYGFLDSNNVLHRIQLAEEYIIKLYRESETSIRVVTTKLDGTPVSLTLNVYKCDGWMDTYRGGNRKELIGTVTTGSDGVGYFEYDGELALLHFEWARDDEGYAYNYIVAGKPKYRALKYGEPDWYV